MLTRSLTQTYLRKVQSGEPVTTPDFKVVQEPTFEAKVNEVVAALSVSSGPTNSSNPEIGNSARDEY